MLTRASTRRLVSLGTPQAKAELRRRGRDAQGRKVRSNGAPAAAAAAGAALLQVLLEHAAEQSSELYKSACEDPEGTVDWLTSPEGTRYLRGLSRGGYWLTAAPLAALDEFSGANIRKKALNRAITYLKTSKGRTLAVRALKKTC